MTLPVTCLLTVHGIGFQQAPDEQAGIPGYADMLHERLHKQLTPGFLGDDPHRGAGPVYVQSHWPPDSHSTEQGLKRLGSWVTGESPQRATIDVSRAPLIGEAGTIAHVALVYSHLEDQGAHLGATVEAGVVTALWFPHYSTVRGLMQMAFHDIPAMVHHPVLKAQVPSSLGEAVRRRDPTAPAAPSGLLRTVRALEADVAAYICRNDLRERVRSFVYEALLRLCFRPDVDRVVINTHSNGTVVTFDVLQRLPSFAAQKVRWFVTCGSPLRKYVEMDFWGNHVGCMDAMGPPKKWTNFWDPLDPVADPLAPGSTWRRGMPLPLPATSEDQGQRDGLFQAIDEQTGVAATFPIDDRVVDNVKNSGGGGLQAHNYWDNDSEVVKPLAEILQEVSGAPR